MSAPTQLSTIEAALWLKTELESGHPKCANCKWMRPIAPHAGKPGHWSMSREYGEPILGKGACQEPSVGAVYPTLFYVTDFMLCSQWEPQEKTVAPPEAPAS